jgi:hypothetical protein
MEMTNQEKIWKEIEKLQKWERRMKWAAIISAGVAIIWILLPIVGLIHLV